MEKNFFGKKESLALKGIATLMLLMHHLFGKEWYFENFDISFYPFPEHIVVNFALACKISVPIFAFISGYGLFLNIDKSKLSAQNWIWNRYLKTFSGYWYIWVISCVVMQLFNGLFFKTYFSDNIFSGIFFMFTDFFGLSNILGTNSLNGTWWYMSVIFIFILIMPLLYKFKDNLIWLFLIVVFINRVILQNVTPSAYTGQNSVYTYLKIFIIGSIFARYGLFDKVISMKYKWIRFILELMLMVFLYKTYHIIDQGIYNEIRFVVFPIIVILFAVEFLITIPFLKNCLEFTGKYSMNVFLIHTFISGTLLHSFIYGLKYFPLILIVLLLISLAISIMLEKIRKLVKYDSLINKMMIKENG